MTEPVSTSVATYFSIAKIWSIVAGVCGSIIPILALSEKSKVTAVNGLFMALTGSSFSIFVGPWLSQKLGFTSLEGTVALAWIMGASGVFVVRSFLKWLENEGSNAINTVVHRVIGKNIPVVDDVKQDNPPNAS
jgi:positive regulator of sigma E activity